MVKCAGGTGLTVLTGIVATSVTHCSGPCCRAGQEKLPQFAPQHLPSEPFHCSSKHLYPGMGPQKTANTVRYLQGYSGHFVPTARQPRLRGSWHPGPWEPTIWGMVPRRGVSSLCPGTDLGLSKTSVQGRSSGCPMRVLSSCPFLT